MALWGGRFTNDSHELFKSFNDSLHFDYQLAEQDIVGSITWSKALEQVKVLTTAEQQKLEHALKDLLEKVKQDPEQILQSDAEDIHSWVEGKLVESLGELGKKLHTGRSRNDQVATDLKLWARAEGKQRIQEIIALQKILIQQAKTHVATIMPGYTHLQRAQPITFAHWCMAYISMLDRDVMRLQSAMQHMNTCPLGSAALAGSGYPVNRNLIATDLGFHSPALNSLDAVSDRDFVVEFLSTASLSMVHLSRMAEDLIFYNSGEAGFVELSDAVTSGSSLMPQKKNPDALEIIRGKTGRVCAALQALLMTLKGTPLTYNKDFQEDKQGLFDAMFTWSQCLQVAALVCEGIEVNKARCLEAAQKGYANATDLADYLVDKGIAFRDAHHIAGEAVVYAIKQDKPLEELSLLELKKFSDLIEDDIFAKLSLESYFAKRDVIGGVNFEQQKKSIERSSVHVNSLQAINKFEVKQATIRDVAEIKALVDHWAAEGENLPRQESEIIRDIPDFAVAKDGQHVVGCASIYVYNQQLAEVRSLGIDTKYHGQGLGKLLMHFMLDKARRMSLQKVFVLTRAPEFFTALGFVHESKDNLPEKVFKDCQFCPKLEACDEVALVYIL